MSEVDKLVSSGLRLVTDEGVLTDQHILVLFRPVYQAVYGVSIEGLGSPDSFPLCYARPHFCS